MSITATRPGCLAGPPPTTERSSAYTTSSASTVPVSASHASSSSSARRVASNARRSSRAVSDVGGPREAVRRGQHRPDESPYRLLVRAARTERVEKRQRLTAQPERLLLHTLRRVNRAPAKPAFEEVDMVAAETRVRRAHEPVELGAPTSEPGEAEQREQRAAERGSGRASSSPRSRTGAEPVNAVSSGARQRSSARCNDRDFSWTRPAAV